MMELLQYIFENYQDEEYVQIAQPEELADELEQAGFDPGEIDSALSWLDGLVDSKRVSYTQHSSNQLTTRIYHPFEAYFLPPECRGFLLSLEQRGILNQQLREAVIDRVLALESDKPIEFEQLKWVVLMVLFNTPGYQEAAIWLENIDACFH